MRARRTTSQGSNAGDRVGMLDVRVPVDALQIGMFVSGVDCGWQKTPFLLEGLLITSAADIAILTTVTGHVTVDPARSTDQVMADFFAEAQVHDDAYPSDPDPVTLPGMAIADADQSAATGLPESVQTAAPADRGFDKMVDAERPEGDRQSWWHRMAAPLRFWHRAGDQDDATTKVPRAAFLPDDMPLVAYQDHDFSWPAVPAALTTCQSAVSLLTEVTQSIAARSLTDFGRLDRAAQGIAEHIIAHPAAILWALKMLETDDKLYRRGLEVAVHLTVLGRHLGLPRALLADLAMIGFLLDIGKTGLPTALLDREGALSLSEQKAMQTHVNDGLALIRRANTLPDSIVRAVAEHHERVDGTGYPQGLAHTNISLYGKMAAIVDGYVAMVNPRHYAQTYAPLEAIKQLFAGVDTHWHGPLVEQFVQAIGVFPVGSVVELSSGHVAVVIQHTALRRLEPVVLIVTHRDKSPRPVPMQIDMLRHNARHAASRLRIFRGLPDGSHGIDARDFYLGAA